MKYFVIFCLTIWLCLSLNGQKPSDNIHLAEKYPDKDFVILNKFDATSLRFKKDTLEFIHKNENTIYYTSDRSAAYYKHSIENSKLREMTDISAYTLAEIPDKNKYKKYIVKHFDKKQNISNSIFYEDITTTSFEYENLKKGSISFKSFTLKYNYPQLPIIFFFGGLTPILKSELKITADNNIDLNYIYVNMLENNIDFTKNISKKETTYSWKLNNIEPYKEEDGAPDPLYYVPHIIVSIKSYTKKDGKKVNVMSNVSDLYHWYYSLLKKVKTENTEEIKSILDQIIDKNDDEIIKVKKVFSWVQKNIKYIAIVEGLGGFTPRNPDKIMHSRYGDCKDMSTLIVTMLEMLGIDAHPAWVGSRKLPYKYNDVPSPCVDNHMIAVHKNKSNNQYIFLDATDSYISFGMPTEFIQGKEVLISNEENFSIETVPIVDAEVNLFNDTVNLTIENNLLKGSGKVILKGYFDCDSKRTIDAANNEEAVKNYISFLTRKGSNKYLLNNYSVQNNDAEMLYIYDFELGSYIKKNDNDLYINMNLDKSLENSKFFKDDRVLPSENDFKKSLQLCYKLNIPLGYEVKYIPDNSSFFNDKFSFDIKYEHKNNSIIYNYSLILNYIMLNLNEQKTFNEMLKLLKAAYKDNVILSKTK